MARLHSKKRTIYDFVLARPPVFSPLTHLQTSSREKHRVAIVNELTMPRLVNDRTVDQRAQLAANRVGGGRTHLGHEHHSEVLGGRDPARCGGGPAPVVLAWDTEPAEHRG